jgi:hypothetical protein
VASARRFGDSQRSVVNFWYDKENTAAAMTNANLPGHWLTNPKIDTLSDRAWRTFTGSLMYSAEQGTDGRLPRVAHRFLHPNGFDPTIAAELVSAHLWTYDSTADEYAVADWSKSQSTAKQVEEFREGARERQRKARATKAASKSDVTRDEPRDVARDVDETRRDEPRQDETAFPVALSIVDNADQSHEPSQAALDYRAKRQRERDERMYGRASGEL